MNSKQIIITVALVIIASGVSFFAGTKYRQQKVGSTFNKQLTGNQNFGPGQQNGQGRANGTGNGTNRGQGGPMGGQNVGEITNMDDKSITIKLADGSSKIILISDSTTYGQSTTAAKTDLKVGTKVAVRGDTNTDGSITSKSIEINPIFAAATITPTTKQ